MKHLLEIEATELEFGHWPDDSDSVLDRVNATLLERKRFRDSRGLRSRRDEFSRIKLDTLITMIPATALVAIFEEFVDDRDRAKCIRLHLRGLSVNHAIWKVRNLSTSTPYTISVHAA